MSSEQVDRLLDILDRAVSLGERWYERVNPKQEPAPNAEVWRRGEAPPEPQSHEEYQKLPADGPGRFERLIKSAGRSNPES